jgi:organic hydroperoxide reductase OsmC/OhrA
VSRRHEYRATISWTGNLGTGTSHYRAYSRNHEIRIDGKPSPIPGSSDPAFRGDPARYNPEELLVASLSACHMLWFLHLCADAGIVVTGYSDEAVGVMVTEAGGSGRFTEVVLRPRITITDAARSQEAAALNDRVHELCFIAASVNFPVLCQPEVTAA